MDEPTDELTAWEDINPGMVLAPPPGLPTEYSDPRHPASAETFRNELTACLALVAPVGMSEEARGEWLAVAWETLSDLPPDILAVGCKKARETCDHPSKIVPTIVAETADWMIIRSAPAYADPPMMIAGPIRPRSVGVLMDSRGKPMSDEETGMLNEYLEKLDSPARYRADGSKQPGGDIS